MSNEAQDYNIATIRQLLLAALTPDELRRFCYDRPTFRPIVDLFGPGQGLSAMVDQVVEFCDRQVLLDQLLTEVRQTNPRQYARFIEPEPSKAEPAPTTPEILTISHPISLQLVRVPAGEFQMGSDKAKDKYASDDELPLHSVCVPEFHIGRYPVTNEQYHTFVKATQHREPDHWGIEALSLYKTNHPVVNVSWKDAVAFCAWLSQETGQPFRLPTEAEWEKAARGTDGRIYPWGSEPPDEERCTLGEKVTTSIGRYSPAGDSPFGCADMAGNVMEWCQSLYSPYPYAMDDGREDLEADGFRVLRGGSFDGVATLVRCASRHWSRSSNWYDYYGFRVAQVTHR
jgi:formylglycine-generating enzyme required for sulfatase activity